MRNSLTTPLLALTLVAVLADQAMAAEPTLDIIFVNENGADQVCLGDGLGGFTCDDMNSEMNASWGVALGYIDDDFSLDAVIANMNNQKNRVCLGDGGGGFTCSDVSDDLYDTAEVALGFVDGDAILDAVFANRVGGGGWNRVCLGDGAGDFTCADVSIDQDPSGGVALGDIDGDQNLDAVFANMLQRDRVCLGDGAGHFDCSDVSNDTKDGSGVVLGYFDADENLDAVFSNGNLGLDRQRRCLGDGNGGFTCGNVSPEDMRSYALAAGYVDGNNTLDVIFADCGSGRKPRVCLGDGLGSFTCSDVSPDSFCTESVALGDVNADQELDAVFGNSSQPNRVCLGDGKGGFTCTEVGSAVRASYGVALGYLDEQPVIFFNGFESGDLSAWSGSVQ